MPADVFSQRLSVLGPVILQALAILALGIIIATRDGPSTQDVINALLILIGGNALAGLAGHAANAYAQVQATKSAAQVQIAQANSNSNNNNNVGLSSPDGGGTNAAS